MFRFLAVVSVYLPNMAIVEASLRDFLPRPNETPQWVPAYVPELARIGQVGQRLHEHALG